jgi:hypothetical protein
VDNRESIFTAGILHGKIIHQAEKW